MADTCNTSTQEAEAGDLKVPGQCGLHIDTLSQKEKQKRKSDDLIFQTKIARLFNIISDK
jgi:hypothetical protein